MKNWLPDRCTAILMQGEILRKLIRMAIKNTSSKNPHRVFYFVLSLHTQQAKISCEISSYSYVV